MAIQLYVATSLWEKCTYDSLKGVCYSVLHAVTDSVRCLLCPSITDKLLTYYHLNHKIACLFSPGMGTGVLVYTLSYTKINSVVCNFVASAMHCNCVTQNF